MNQVSLVLSGKEAKRKKQSSTLTRQEFGGSCLCCVWFFSLSFFFCFLMTAALNERPALSSLDEVLPQKRNIKSHCLPHFVRDELINVKTS